ncbi:MULTISPECIES: LysR family transcriptional regulator [Thalassospira]|uniref:LysR family transcriptional regulator n=1 Tax=Thalassospira aquimaris TaxID=3037796 RepID=A0ABT6GDW9_9PROT|nr:MULTISPECIES: LysR family transcriptional regulator [Thalassospira]MDG4720295.1 LysR family transcriptional regulator [Thalassospira sp. FZY0004]
MSIRRLKTLIAISKHGSLSAAAANEHLTRSAVSLQMKQFEDELGVEIFDRRKRIPELNARGRLIVPKAIEVLNAYEELRRLARGEERVTGELNIGAMFTAMTGVVPHAIKQMRSIYPHLHIQAAPGHSANLVAPVDRGVIDAAFIGRPPVLGSQLVFHKIAEEPYQLLVPIDLDMDDPREILETFPFIRISRSLWSGQLIDNWLVREKITVNEAMELDGIQMISTMVYHGLGVAVVPRRCVQAPNPVTVKEIPIKSLESRPVGILVRHDSPKTNLIEALCTQMLHVVKHLGSPALLEEGAQLRQPASDRTKTLS